MQTYIPDLWMLFIMNKAVRSNPICWYVVVIRHSKVAVAAGENCCRRPVLGDVQKSI